MHRDNGKILYIYKKNKISASAAVGGDRCFLSILKSLVHGLSAAQDGLKASGGGQKDGERRWSIARTAARPTAPEVCQPAGRRRIRRLGVFSPVERQLAQI
ncbi:MAG: hypothetical protein LBU12_06210 [Deltaproteobacteria bacterium]|jgi:hypothetical protein|nr:hypothetical protein [Deltaproteobacteria bacterium]